MSLSGKVYSPARRRLLADGLRALILGEVWEDDAARAAYAATSSIFRHVPALVVAPRDPADLARIVAFARDEGISITPRGAGTSRAGQDQGDGILLDLTRHFRARPAIDAGARRARVLPGITLRELNDAARKEGLFFPPDPSSGQFCTVGGMAANNAGGPSAIRLGITRDWILGLDVVLAGGLTARPRKGEAPAKWAAPLARAAEVLAAEAALIRSQYPRRVKNSSGYNLKGTVPGGYGSPARDEGAVAGASAGAGEGAGASALDGIDPFPLLIGSEGTLGIITALHVRLAPLPGGSSSVLLLFDDLAEAARAVPGLTASGAGKIELLDRVLLERVRDVLGKGRAAAEALLCDAFRYALLVEHDGSTAEEARAGSERGLAEVGSSARGRVLDDPAERNRLWQVRSMAAGHLHLLPGRKRPIAIVEDGAVDPARLPEYVEAVRSVHRRAGVESFYFGHAGDGNVHVNSLLDLADPEDARRARDILDGVHHVIREMGGSLSGEHGDGRLRTPYLRAHYGALFDRVFVPVKRAMDPDGIFNPGIIAAPERQGEDAIAGAHRYRPPGATAPGEAAGLGPAALHAIDCHGCGKCRTYCPTFLATGREEDLPRARANLVRETLLGALALSELAVGLGRRSLSTCVGCDRCLTDCSSLVDIGAASAAARAAVAMQYGRGRDEELLRRPRALSGLAAALAPVARVAGKLSIARAGLELVAGVDRRRRPPPAGRWRPRTSETTAADGSGRRAATDRVVYFPGCHALNGDPGGADYPGEGAATVAVLQAIGTEVHVAPEGCCGIARYTYGADDGLRAEVMENVDRWKPWLEAGWELVTTAPSCHHMIAHRYGELLGEAARPLEGKVWDVFQWLERGDRAARLQAMLGPANAGMARLPLAYHDPCHARIGERSIGAATTAVLAATGMFDLRQLPDRCCGMAGTFGMRTKGYELSMEIGSPQLDAARGSGAAVVATGCGTCQTQFREDPALRPVHPISVLAVRLSLATG